MNTQIFKQAQELIAENSAALLTGTGVIGVVTTAVLTGKASFKASDVLKEEYVGRMKDFFNDPEINDLSEEEQEAHKKILLKDLTTIEKARVIGPLYIPAIASGITTIGAIVFSYRISVSKSAALAAAYGISEKAFAEYKGKVLEHISPKKAEEIKQDMAKQKMTNNPPPSSEVMVIADGDILCLDAFSGRYFRCGIERIRRAENDINIDISNHNTATLGDFYEKIGLPQTDISEKFKWTLNNILEVEYTTRMTDDGRPCVVITFINAPVPLYDEFT